jgi:hypothetical protein
MKETNKLLKAILAHCKDCCCGYIDGKVDCENTTCSLYSFMPYGKKKKSKN